MNGKTDGPIMQLTPRSAMSACGILALFVMATAAPASSEPQVFPGGCRVIDSMDADAWGDAVALIVRINGDDVLDSPYAQVSNSQDGPGQPPHAEATEIPVDVLDGLVTAKILTSRVDLKVDEDPLRSQAWAQAEVADLNILNGTVTAQLIKGWAHAKAEVNLADTMTVDSNIVGLQVGDLADFEVAPGVQVLFPEVVQEVVGPGSFVKTYVREDASRFPGNGSILYVGDTTVTMLHVYLANVPGVGSVEVIASKAHAHAEAPTPFCGLVQNIKSAAYVARSRPEVDSDTSILVGEQHIGVVGGRGHQQLFGAQVPVGPRSYAEVNVTESEVSGYVNASVESRSFAMSKVLGLCILQDGEVAPENATIEDYGDCLIGVTAIRAESNSLANETAAISWGSVTIVGVTVLGIDVCEQLGFTDENDVEGNGSSTTNICKPPKNSTLEIGPYVIHLNQREYDNTTGPGHTGYYVRAVRIQGPLVGDLILSRAYTQASYKDTASGDHVGFLEGQD
jgi:hypothetical protein